MVKGRISVITLSYNNLQYYKECLESILCQSYHDIEWILSDDCSDDFGEYINKIEEMVRNNTGNISNYVIRQNSCNMGVVKNYKQAIDICTGEYIFYLAIDDLFYDKDVLKDVVQYFKTTGLQIFTGYRERFYKDGRLEVRPSKYEADVLKSGNIDKILSRSIRVAIIIGSCTPFKKELVDKYGFVEDKYTHLEDWPRYLNLLENSVKIGFLERCLVKYRDGGITFENVTNEKLICDFRMLFSKYMYPPYSDMMPAMKDKKYIIAWGAAGGAVKCLNKWETIIKREIDFIVDSDEKKWGRFIEGKKIYSPELISELDKNDIYILIFSITYYLEIAQELEKIGLEEGKNFDIVTKDRVL
ncbi:MAG: glycosyltransferase [Lachnospiraceae bacterium]|nr:glycosyltransferase [Lachnospiraceae bacterium]